MTSQQQQENGLFEIKVPIFCEWTFQKNTDSGMASSLYNYVFDLAYAKNDDGFINLKPIRYSLPGFPGISYNLVIAFNLDNSLYLGFTIDMFYQKYQFDADFTCTVTNCEPIHFVQSLNNANRGFFGHNFLIYNCADDCKGCPLCAKIVKKIVIRIEGAFTVKWVDVLRVCMPLCEAVKKMGPTKARNTRDFVIVAEGKEISVHKSVLAENSTVFARMFDSGNWKETMENKIVIPDFPYKVVSFAVETFYYYTYLRPHTPKEDILMVFRFADKYDIEKLTSYLKDFISFTPHNVVEYANYFFQNDAGELVNNSIDYILSCSQYSIPIKDVNMLDAPIRAMFFDRTLISSVLKKDPKAEHRRFNYDEDDN